MPIKKRTSSKVKENVKTYVFLNPKGGLIVRTPATCTYWDMEFRKRITAGYAKPRSAKLRNSHVENYEKHGLHDAVYSVAGNKLKVQQIVENIGTAAYVVVLRTEVHNLTTGKKLFLNHEDPAMRMLMVYVFLTGDKVPGVPQLHIADIDEEW